MPDQEVSEITPTTAKFDNDVCCAGNAIDKDLSTRAATSTKDGYGMLEIEYGKTFFLRKVIMYYSFYNNWFHLEMYCAQSIDRFKACVDIHSDVDVSVYQGDVKQKSCGTFSPTYALDQSDQIYTLVCNVPVVGDRVRFTKTTPKFLSLSEVVVTGADIGMFRDTSNFVLYLMKDPALNIRLLDHFLLIHGYIA